MTDIDQIPPYHYPPMRTAIQIFRSEKQDWLVWNWDTKQWDERARPVTQDGNGQMAGSEEGR